MAEAAVWCLDADGRWVADVAGLGSLVVWLEPSGYRWAMAALGAERRGYLSAAAAKAAAVREARQRLVTGLTVLVALDAARFRDDRGARLSTRRGEGEVRQGGLGRTRGMAAAESADNGPRQLRR